MNTSIPQGIWTRDAQQAFKDAIGNEEIPHEELGDWMYMYSEGIQDWFKNINTRKYIKTNYTQAV